MLWYYPLRFHNVRHNLALAEVKPIGFASYRLYKKNKPNDSLLFTFTSRSDTAKQFRHTKMGMLNITSLLSTAKNIVSNRAKSAMHG